MNRDYILRMIEQAGMVLRALIGRLSGSSAEEVTQELRRAAQIGLLDLDVMRVADDPTALAMVAPGGEPDPTRTWIAAEVMYVDGMNAEAEGRTEEAVARFARALLLYRMVHPGWVLPTGFPEARARIAELETRLARPNA